MPLLRIGEPHNVCAMPVYAPFQCGKVEAAVEWVSAPLEELERRMLEGTLDASPVSILEYLRQRDHYDLLPEISVSSWGRTGNTVLYYRDSLANAKEIAMPRRSPLGATLGRWFIKSMTGVEPEIICQDGDPAELLQRYPALLLGDSDVFLQPAEFQGTVPLDIGQAWWQATQSPLVQMVWVVSKSVSDEDFDDIMNYFIKARYQIGECKPYTVSLAAQRTQREEPALDGYLQLCNYDLTPAHLKGIELLKEFLSPSLQTC